MAKLDKLQISGIRSFSPFEHQVQHIRFLTPLTLLLGPNGCGKTTIVECLRFACCGEFPGISLFADPRMSESASTKAQIRLVLVDSEGKRVTISKAVEVIRSGDDLVLSRRLPTITSVNSVGEDVSVGGRRPDVTAECCRILDVSSAVLNNVMLCRQEDSCWPLDGGERLKEKFNEIFEVEKYEKILGKLKEVLQVKQERLKLLNEELSNLKEEKECGEREKKVLEEKKVRLKSCEGNIKLKSEQLASLYRRIKNNSELYKVFDDLNKELTAKEATKTSIVEQQDTIKRSIFYEVEGNDEELENQVKTFQEDREKYENLIFELEKKKNEISVKAKIVSKAIQELQSHLDKFNAEKTHYQEKCLERKHLMEKIDQNFDEFTHNDKIKNAIQVLKANVDFSEIALRRFIEEKEMEELDLQNSVDTATESSMRILLNIESSTKQIQELHKKINEVSTELLSLSCFEDYCNNFSSKIEHIDKTISNLETTSKKLEESQKVDNYRKNIEEMEMKLENLEAEDKILCQNDVIEAKLDTEKNLIIKKQNEIDRIKKKHSNKLKQLFGETLPEKNLKDSLLELQTKSDLTLKNLAERINTKQSDVTILEINYNIQIEKIIASENELKTKQEKNQLQQLKVVNEDVEILKKQLEEIEQNLKINKTELESLKLQTLEPQEILNIIKEIISDISSLDQNNSDIETSKQTVEMLTDELVEPTFKKSKKEIEGEIKHLKSEIGELRKKTEAQLKKINKRKDRLQQLAQERITLVDKQMNMKARIQNKPTLESQKNELEEKLTNLKEKLVQLKIDSTTIHEDLNNAVKNKEIAGKMNKQEIQEKTNKINKDRNIVNNIEKLQNEINYYINQNIDNKLSTTENELEKCKNEEKALEEEMSHIIRNISEKKERLARQNSVYQNLKSNIILREKKQLEANVDKEIQNLKQRIENYKTIQEEKRQVNHRKITLEKEINNLISEKTQLLQTIEILSKEISKPENSNIYKSYIFKYYQVKIAKKVISDLVRYILAFDKSIVEFHKSKMVEINRKIRDLWRNIYRGNDIDYIYIEIKTEKPTLRNTKSHDYKMVQVRRGIESDMRGRCSAGQKTLACFVVRMALAECLATNCGIFALDEPTTNLDRENVRSLCDTLCRIVEARRCKKNFQLLVITHDEEFVSMLTRAQEVPYFFKIERDCYGFSCIKKEPLHS